MIGCLQALKFTKPSDLYSSQAFNYRSKTVIEVDVKVGKDVVHIYHMSSV